MTTITMTDTPRVYVSCIAAYNNGKLHGEWIDATQDTDDIWAEIHQMLALSPEPDAEEWRIDDYENFGDITISESFDIDKLSELAQAIAEHGEAYAAYVEIMGVEYATVDGFEEAYQGEWDSEVDFAENLMDETMEIPQHLQYYIDYEKFSNDLFINDYNSCSAGRGRKVYVFRNQ